MNWELYRWVWVLQSPLSVGTLPSGSLNRCHLYIPARAIWGAITAEVARRSDGHFPDYAVIGNGIQEEIRFTYLFPAVKINQEWKAWLPCYMEDKGLCWQLEDANDDFNNVISNQIFRSRLLYTRPGTSINPESDSAEEGSLHETECIQIYWSPSEEKNNKEYQQIGMIGYVLVKSNSSYIDSIKEIETLLIGGDTRYGFGKLRQVDFSNQSYLFNNTVNLSDSEPIITGRSVLGHTATVKNMSGDIEALAGWDYLSNGRLKGFEKTYWTPGSFSPDGQSDWKIGRHGHWENVNKNS